MATRTFRIVSVTLALLLNQAIGQQAPLAPSNQLQLAENRADWAAAAEITQRLLEEKPGDLDLLTRLARYQRSSGDLGRAADTLQRVSSLAGKASSDVLEVRGDIAKDEDRPADALSDYQLALRAAPDSVRLLEKIALHHEKAGDPDTANIYYKKLADLRKERSDHVHLARAAVRRRDWNGMVGHLAIASELRYLNQREKDVQKFETLFSKAVQLGRYDRAIKARPKDLATMLERALLFHSCGFYAEALEDAQRAARIDSRAPHVRVALAYYYAAAGDRKKGAEFNVNTRAVSKFSSPPQLFGALAHLDRKIVEKPGDLTLLRSRAELLLDHNQAPLALEDIDRALVKEPDSISIQLLNVRALEAIGQTAEARALVRQLAVAHPEHEDILQQIGQIQIEDGLYDGAIVTFDKILAKRPRYEAARDSRTLCYKRLQRQPPTDPNAPAEQPKG